MAEYIEKGKATQILREEASAHYPTAFHVGLYAAARAIDSIPAADVAPVRHGRWLSVLHKKARICSWCERDEPYKFTDEDANVFNYCPNCGARMEGGEP